MSSFSNKRAGLKKTLPKMPSGIAGLDEITEGGLPKGRPTLICGAAGSGKTLFAIEFIVRGALNYKEPGVFMAFEEKSDELAINVALLGFDLEKLQKQTLSNWIMYILTGAKLKKPGNMILMVYLSGL